MTENRVHELLPWYVGGTLRPAEREMFEEHLPSCEPCREEMTMLTRLRAQLEEHGESFLADHPAPEELVALLMPDQGTVDGDRARSLRQHLALCATCAEEASWLRGESRAESALPAPAAGAPARSRPWTRWVAAAAAMLLLALVLPRLLVSPRPGMESGLVAVDLVPATQRADGDPTPVSVSAGAVLVHLLLEVELAPQDFPARLVIEDAAAKPVYTQDGIGVTDTYEGRYLFVRLRRDELPDGRYTARVTSSKRPAEPTLYPFRIGSAPDPRR